MVSTATRIGMRSSAPLDAPTLVERQLHYLGGNLLTAAIDEHPGAGLRGVGRQGGRADRLFERRREASAPHHVHLPLTQVHLVPVTRDGAALGHPETRQLPGHALLLDLPE